MTTLYEVPATAPTIAGPQQEPIVFRASTGSTAPAPMVRLRCGYFAPLDRRPPKGDPPAAEPRNAEAREPLAQFPGSDAAYLLTLGAGSSSSNHPVGMMPLRAAGRTIRLLP
jgi:hypothetical protein